jgi:uncharacterized RDD family membrane protein YckC
MSGVPPDVPTAQTLAAQARRRRESANVAIGVQGPTPPERVYAGLVTRALAFGLDGAIVSGCAVIVGVVVGLGLSILHLPERVDIVIAAILGGLGILWTIGYFAFFWSTTGQTPGDRVMRIRVVDGRDRGPLRPMRAILRFGGIVVAAIPLLAGFLIMLWDDRRRCLQDRVARTVVVEDLAPEGPRTLRR